MQLDCPDPHGERQLAYTLWEANASGSFSRNVPIVAVHGLTRNGRDFDRLARSFAGLRRVVCPDMAGRGRSDWLRDPAGYGYPLYQADCDRLLAELGMPMVDWIGTSMGGLIGLLMASRPNSPIRRLVLNDIGPFIPRAALERIGGYVGRPMPPLPDLDAVAAYLRSVHGSFGPLRPQQWLDLARHSATKRPEGGYRLSYDPAIGHAFRGDMSDVDLWEVYDRVRCPTLVLRGAISDLLLAETARDMTGRGPRAALVEFPGVGHAPALMDDDQIAVIHEFLNG